MARSRKPFKFPFSWRPSRMARSSRFTRALLISGACFAMLALGIALFASQTKPKLADIAVDDPIAAKIAETSDGIESGISQVDGGTREKSGPAPLPSGAPIIAIVLDDMGGNEARTRLAIALPGFVTL